MHFDILNSRREHVIVYAGDVLSFIDSPSSRITSTGLRRWQVDKLFQDKADGRPYARLISCDFYKIARVIPVTSLAEEDFSVAPGLLEPGCPRSGASESSDQSAAAEAASGSAAAARAAMDEVPETTGT
jgi:hypothetical protein